MPKTILICDDEIYIRNLFRIRIQNTWKDINILEAGDGNAAYEICTATPVDLAIIDINMPYLNGIDLIQTLRQESLAKDMSIIIVSANNADNVHDRLRALGVKDFISKLDSTGSIESDNPLLLTIKRLLNL